MSSFDYNGLDAGMQRQDPTSPDIQVAQRVTTSAAEEARLENLKRSAGQVVDPNTLRLVTERWKDVYRVIEQTTEKIEQMTAKQLAAAAKHNEILHDNIQAQKDFNEMQRVGFDKLDKATQKRIQQNKAVIAEGDAYQTLTGQTPTATMAGKLAAGTKESAKEGNYFKQQWDQFKKVGTTLDITRPGTILEFARANPVMAAVLAAPQVFNTLQGMESKGLGVSIPGLGHIGVPFTDFGNLTREGQVTGEGYGAGVAARAEAFTLGANPFDVISNETAKAIVAGVRGKGFRGELAQAFERSVSGAVADLGIDPNRAIGIGEQYFRQGRMGEFQTLLGNLDDLAKNTNRSIDHITTLFESLNTQFTATGGIGMSPFARGIVDAIAKLPGLTNTQQQNLAQVFPQLMQQMTGLPSTFGGTQEGFKRGAPIMERTLEMLSNTWKRSGSSDMMLSVMAQQYGVDYETMKEMLQNPKGFLSRISQTSQDQARRGLGADIEADARLAQAQARRRAGGGGILGFFRTSTGLPGIEDRGRIDAAGYRAAEDKIVEDLKKQGVTSQAQIYRVLGAYRQQSLGAVETSDGRIITHAGALQRALDPLGRQAAQRYVIRLDTSPNFQRMFKADLQREDNAHGRTNSYGTTGSNH